MKVRIFYLLWHASRLVRVSVCLIVVGALAPLCFLFSVFQNARPPATPRRLGPPLTERLKTLGPTENIEYIAPIVREAININLYGNS